MNKYFSIFSILLLLGCHKNLKTSNLFEKNKKDSSNVDEKQIKKTIRQLVESRKSDQALKLLDSLINFNKSNGFLYFEKGFVEGYNFHHKAAIREYKIAERLQYNTEECQFMIEFSKKIINDTNR